jgi:hypothetical protein
VPNEDEPTREPFLKKWFFGSSARAEREEKVLQYIIHRTKEETPLHDVIRENYVRRNCSQEEIHDLVNDPEFVHACRKHLWQVFRSGELDPKQGSLRSQLSTNDSPADDAEDVSGSASPGV